MKTCYTITACMADDGLITVERTINGQTDLVAAFDGFDLDDLAGIYQLVSECQELADSADALYARDQTKAFKDLSDEYAALRLQFEELRATSVKHPHP